MINALIGAFVITKEEIILHTYTHNYSFSKSCLIDMMFISIYFQGAIN